MNRLLENFDFQQGEKTFEELFQLLKATSVVGEVATITDFFYRNYEQMASIVAISRHPENKHLLQGKTAYEFIAVLAKEAKDFPRKDKLLTKEEVSTYMNIARRKRGLAKASAKSKPSAPVPAVASPAVATRSAGAPVASPVVHAPIAAPVPSVALVEAPGVVGKSMEQLSAEGFTPSKFAELCKKYSRVYNPSKQEWNQELADMEAYLLASVSEEKLKMRDSGERRQGHSAMNFGELYDLIQKIKVSENKRRQENQ